MTDRPNRADDVARALQEEPPVLDDLRRARMEKAVLERPAAGRARGGFRAGVAVGLAAAAALALAVWAWPEHVESVASVETFRGGVLDRAAEISDGETVVTAADQLMRVRFGAKVEGVGSTLVEVSPGTRVSFVSIEGRDHVLRLERGEVRVEFHPSQRGAERISVETEDALVRVVGTVFDVRADLRGTRVRVEEGVVRVEPVDGAAERVSAGREMHVPRANLEARQEQLEDVRDPTEVVRVDSAQTAEQVIDQETNPGPIRSAARRVEGAAAGAEMIVEDEPAGEAEVGAPPSREREPVESIPLDDDVRFELAQGLFDQGRLEAARHELYGIARTTPSLRSRSRAWTLVAETFERERDETRAIEAYRRAARGRSPEASDALFALARLRVAAGEREAGKAAYLEYLSVAPDGALAGTVRRALCRLGERRHCAE